MVKRLLSLIPFCFLLLTVTPAYAGYLPDFAGKSAYVPGVSSFKKLPKLEVVEYFNFACGHCYDFAQKGEEALLKKYGDKIVYRAVPIYWGQQNHYPTLLYLMLKGSVEEKYQFRRMVFDAYFLDKINIFEKQNLAMMTPDFSLANEFIRKADSPEGKEMANAALVEADALGVHETPTFVINQSIVVQPGMTGKTIEEFINNLNVVIDSILEKNYVK